MANNPNHMDNLKNFQSGDDPRRNTSGRPRKLVLAAKDIGYKPEEVKTTLEVMAAMEKEEIIEVMKNKHSTMLELITAAVLKKCMEKGSFFNMEMLLTRAQGKPKETQDVNLTGTQGLAQVNVQVLNTGVPLGRSEKEVRDAAGH